MSTPPREIIANIAALTPLETIDRLIGLIGVIKATPRGEFDEKAWMHWAMTQRLHRAVDEEIVAPEMRASAHAALDKLESHVEMLATMNPQDQACSQIAFWHWQLTSQLRSLFE